MNGKNEEGSVDGSVDGSVYGSVYGAVVLAAGASTRLGRPKQLLMLDGETLLRRSARTALDAGYDPVVIVLGANADALKAELDALPVTVAVNAEWETGMASSLRVGLRTVLTGSGPVDAVCFLLCDQPGLTPNVLRSLRDTHRETGRPAVVSEYASGATGTPCLVAASLHADLLTLTGDQGAKRLLRNLPPERVATVPFPEGDQDIDTEDDWRRRRQTNEDRSPTSEAVS